MANRSNNLMVLMEGWHGDVEAARASVMLMSPDLLQELYKEAIENEEFRLGKNPDKATVEIQRFIVSRYLGKAGVVEPQTVDLPLLFQGAIASPHLFNIGSLFGVLPKGVDQSAVRSSVDMRYIESRQGIDMYYTGQRLYQSDLDIWINLFDMTRSAVGGYHTIRLGDLLKRLAKQDTGPNYTWLKRSIKRMRLAALEFSICKGSGVVAPESARELAGTIINLINDSTWNGDHSVTFRIDRRLANLFDNNQYGILVSQARVSLKSELAKKYQCLFSSSRDECQRYRFSTLQEWFYLDEGNSDKKKKPLDKAAEEKRQGRKISDLAAQTRCAMIALVEQEIIHAFWISKPARGRFGEKALMIWKHEDPKPEDFQSKENGILFLGGKTFLRENGKFYEIKDTSKG